MESSWVWVYTNPKVQEFPFPSEAKQTIFESAWPSHSLISPSDNLSGISTLSDGVNNVDVLNNGDFNVLSGDQQVGEIGGNGTVTVASGSTPVADSITAQTLTVGVGARVTIRPLAGGPLSGNLSLKAVPEPSIVVLLAISAIGFIAYHKTGRK
jgi:hypothetical protein